jgi:hypothetical protein
MLRLFRVEELFQTKEGPQLVWLLFEVEVSVEHDFLDIEQIAMSIVSVQRVPH